MLKKALISLCLVSTANASELVHQFNSPSFNGVGYSSHVLSVEQLEAQRRQKLKDEQKALADQAARDAKNTNLAKFLLNLESRIYAQLSKQLADAMFSDAGVAAGGGSVVFQGTTISWTNLGDGNVQLDITNADGTITTITVPIGSFQF
jgi:hypothetical protein